MYKSHLRTPAAKKMSLNGKRARGGQVHIHTTGARSFSWGRDEYLVKYKKEPNNVVFFGRAHKTRMGSFVTEASRSLWLKQKENYQQIHQLSVVLDLWILK